MKVSKLLSVAGIAAATISFAAQDAPTLKRALTPNITETYKIDSKVDETVSIPQAGDTPVSVATNSTLSIKSSDLDSVKGLLNVEVTTTVDHIQADGPLASALNGHTVKPLVQKGTLDATGSLKLEDPKGADLEAMMMAGAENSSQALTLVQLPNKAVAIGDTWDVTVAKGVFTSPNDQKLTAKLVGEKTVDGHNAWVVSITGSFKQYFDSTTVPQADENSPLGKMPMIVKGVVDVNGEGIVDKTTGQTLSMSTKNKMKGTIEITSLNITADQTGTATSRVTLQAPASK